MDSLLDMLGAVLILGIVVLIAFQLNIYMVESNTQQLLRSISQETVNGSDVGKGYCEMMESDLAKIGIGDSTGPSIVLADSDRVTLLSDLDGDGKLDSVRYFLTPAGPVPPGGNPRLSYLCRRQNTEAPDGGGVGVSFLRFDYLDERGRLLPLPVTGDDRSNIRSVQVRATFESPIRLANSTDTTFAAVYWEALRSPVNIR